jgi:hypothetical protein
LADGRSIGCRLLLLAAEPFSPWRVLRAAVVFYDGFDYGAGTLGGTSTASVSTWENAKSNITISNGSLAYPGLQASAGQKVNMSGGTAGFDGARTKSPERGRPRFPRARCIFHSCSR